ncbi:MAG TPA: hypothetical protein VHY20_15160, partial [Pirellulales bacterium]|nr:hypothetical protein [Pirellulales bacterium]
MSNRLAAGILAALWMVSGTGAVWAGEPQAPIELWPGQAPGEKGDIGPEKEMPQKPGGKQVLRLSDVTRPTMTVFCPATDIDTHTA